MASLQQRAACLAIALVSFSDVSESFPINKCSHLPTSMDSRHSNSALHAKAKAQIEDETDAQIRDRILHEIDTGLRKYSQSDIDLSDYGEPIDALEVDGDDDGAIDASTLGQWDESDLEDKFDYEWDPDAGDEDPNNLDPQYEYVEEIPLDEEGNEVGYNPIFGYSNPIDRRTILNPPDSYVIDERTRDDRLVPQDFPDGDPELEANAKIIAFRKSLGQIETYADEFSGMEVPRYMAKWHGYPEQLSYPKKDYMNNRFTKPEDRTDFDALGPAVARKVAVQMARAKNNEWLPAGTSREYHERKIAIYKEKGVITGSTLPGEVDEDTAAKIQPALDVLGDVVELLSIEVDTVFRFKYHGLIKNKRGMEAWAGVLIRNCDVDCTGVVFETGHRKRDPYYDGGDHWYGPY
mmetsp:Transcript_7103/g.12568  ORF Transcript_7103/g.12568 Transcript_7103/m.12568 type:complete len:407 (-) Transcript_7103:244-1464(-)|eukprot:CAMPEP_0183770670 /NCGR_PEP_ID=MMETSP0739-20130205/29581_1 /TAXON_ID=385413 /ORGANISM="Thalassiosira miniscula, Strain CCMP1093" /LENGTH=406 /DNA_ID=CAMNT_0026010781 /DNA_START=22 /DNA_END=1242 /DNA_ORIENTATION=+